MPAPLIPQEIYLLERYASPDYFADMRDAWADMLGVARAALQAFMKHPPSNYHSRPLLAQLDVVWGGTVLANFEYTLDLLNNAFIKLTHGDWQGLKYASNVHSDFCGFSRDHSAAWMDEPHVAAAMPNACQKFWESLRLAAGYASNIDTTVNARWALHSLSSAYGPERGPLNPPAQWPEYRLDTRVRMFTNEPVPHTGIYWADMEEGAPTFQIKGKPAHWVRLGRDSRTGHCFQRRPGWWTLVEKKR